MDEKLKLRILKVYSSWMCGWCSLWLLNGNFSIISSLKSIYTSTYLNNVLEGGRLWILLLVLFSAILVIVMVVSFGNVSNFFLPVVIGLFLYIVYGSFDRRLFPIKIVSSKTEVRNLLS